MECKSVVEHLLDYGEGGQKDTLHSSIDEHLDSCSSCRHEYEKLKRSWSLLDSWKPIEPHPSHRARFWEAVARERHEGIPSKILQVFRKPAFVAVSVAVSVLIVLFFMAGIYSPGPDLFAVHYSPWSTGYNALLDERISSIEKVTDESYPLFAWNDIVKIPDYLETGDDRNDEYPDLQLFSREAGIMDGAHEVILDMAKKAY